MHFPSRLGRGVWGNVGWVKGFHVLWGAVPRATRTDVCVLFLVAALLSQYRDLYGECSLRPREESSGGRCRGRWATKEHKTVEVHLDVQGVYQSVKPS